MAYEFNDFSTDLQIMFPNITKTQVEESFKYYNLGRKMGNFSIGLLDNLKPLEPALGTIFDAIPGVLCTGNGWTIHINDSYILGGVHSHADFFLVSHNTWLPAQGNNKSLQAKGAGTVGNQLDYVSDAMMTDQYGPIKVTQREVIALNIFGYTRNPAGIFKCTHPNLADQAKIPIYICEVNEICSALKKAGN